MSTDRLQYLIEVHLTEHGRGESGTLASSRWDLTLQYLRGFVMEWFDQNPLGQVSSAKRFLTPSHRPG